MTLPNPRLLEQYGSEHCVEKMAQSPLLEALAPLLGIGAMTHDLNHQSKLLAEAEKMNQIARVLEAKKMEGTISALGGTMPKHSAARIESVASTISKFAHIDTEAMLEKISSGIELDEMEKEAIGAILGKMMGAGGKALSRAGGKLQQASKGAVKPPAASAAKASPYRTAAKPAGNVQPAAKAAPAASAPAKDAPLISGKTKAKLMATGAAGAGLYGGYKGLQAVRDYMMVPTATERQWGYQAPLRHNVSPYGY